MAAREEVLKAFAPRLYRAVEYMVALGSDDVAWCWESFSAHYQDMKALLEDIDDACNRPRETD